MVGPWPKIPLIRRCAYLVLGQLGVTDLANPQLNWTHLMNTITSTVVLALLLSACGSIGSAESNSKNQGGAPSGSNPDVIATSTTENLVPTALPSPQLCSSYFTILADNYLVGQIAQLSIGEQRSAATSYLSAISAIKNSPLEPVGLLGTSTLSTLSKLTFSQSSTSAAILETTAITQLKVALGSTCQVLHPSATTQNSIETGATSQGFAASCDSSSTILISSADPTYAALQAISTIGSGVTTTSLCFSQGYSGVLERLSGTIWNPVQPYVDYPCGQAPPDVLYSLFGQKSLNVCFPSS